MKVLLYRGQDALTLLRYQTQKYTIYLLYLKLIQTLAGNGENMVYDLLFQKAFKLHLVTGLELSCQALYQCGKSLFLKLRNDLG